MIGTSLDLGAASADSLLEQLTQLGVLQPIDAHFGRLLARLDAGASPLVVLAGAFASRAVQGGHVCLDLPQLLRTAVAGKRAELVPIAWPALAEWQSALGQSRLVAEAGQDAARPLVVDAASRVYLQRYHRYQLRLVQRLRERLKPLDEIDEARLLAGLEQLFPQAQNTPEPALDYQRLAAVLAVRNRFTLLSGGPGTGKTTTVAKILVLLQQQALATRGTPLLCVLLAPTGKAAQRLTDSLGTGLRSLQLPAELAGTIPVEAATIHRALGYSRRTPTRFIHNAEQPLAADVVLVDEASMVDLALMTKLVEAISPSARLILLGDRDQLASVEAGAVFGDLFNAAGNHSYSPALVQLATRMGCPLEDTASAAPAIADCTIHLTRSYRYNDQSAIGQVARAVRAADAVGLQRVLASSEATWLDSATLSEAQLSARLRTLIIAGYRDYAAATEPAQRLQRLHAFRVLCAHRRGALGVEGMGALIEATLAEEGLLHTDARFYDARPIMITENDYQIGLFNGDVGVVVAPKNTSHAVAYFEDKGGLRAVQTSRLPAHETVFAMTVHKSQGSEFERILLVLPSEPSLLISRELLYTGVTRAKRELGLVASEAVLRQAIGTPIERSSGLRDALWT